MRYIVALFVFAATLFTCAGTASACGVERWDAKVLGDGTVRLAGPYDATVAQIDALPRPFSEDYEGPRVSSERVAYRMQVLVLWDKLEQDGDIHVIVADPNNPAHTLVAEIPDAKNCMEHSPATYVKDVMQARYAFVQAFGIPPVTHYAPVFQRATIIGPVLFDFEHGQRGASPNDAEMHPLLIFNNSLSIQIAPRDLPSYSRPATTPAASSPQSCAGDTVVWVNLRSRIYHEPGSRWYGHTRRGEYMCRRAADAAGYRPAENE